MSLQENLVSDGLERRGRVYYMRIRVPARFASVERRREINRSLKTRDLEEARARLAVARRSLTLDWEARLKRRLTPDTVEAYDAALALVQDLDIPFIDLSTLVEGPIQTLVERIETLATVSPDSATAPAVLGAVAFPRVLLSEMPAIMEQERAAEVRNKNPRQLREWRNKYSNAAKKFCEIVGDKPVLEITEGDAMAFRGHWKKRVAAGEITLDHAVKRLRFVSQLVEAYFERFDVPPSARRNPFAGLRLEQANVKADRKKLAFPVEWIQRRIIGGEGLEGLNREARDITLVAAACGTRQSEIYDLPPEHIRLNDPIPHLLLQPVLDGDYKTQVKNEASVRPVVLLGEALAAMRRNPNGFPRYRGKATYSATVNNYLRDNDLLPAVPPGETGRYSISSIRHTYEDRMTHAKLSNEERAYMMGHSIGCVRGRPVYGSAPDLRMRALYQEMVAFPTEDWSPRPIAELRNEVDRLATELGFRAR